jgi:DNA-binding NtrC family response regulator
VDRPRLTRETGSAAPHAVVGGRETILIAEDEEQVRDWMCRLLRRWGYQVHAVGNGREALAYFRQNSGRIDLLITDLIMPGGLSGRDLGALLQKEQPGLKVLYCSGYTDDILGHDTALRNSAVFLAKPFDMEKFMRRVRARLDAK